jgi:hypothetical protein
MALSTTCERRKGVAAALAVSLLLGHGLAGATPSPADMAAAEALFKSGRALVTAGDWGAGCPKFEASLALYPSPSTMLNIARCHEHDGKLATAWGDYQQAIDLNRDTAEAERRKGLQQIAEKGLADLSPRLPRLRLLVATRPDGMSITRDGKPLPLAALGEALPVDPGVHHVLVSAPGHRAETRNVELSEGKTVTVNLALTPLPADRGPRKTPAWVWVTGGAGIALAGAATYFLVDDLAAIHALRTNCKSDASGTHCAEGYDFAADNARKNRDLGLFVGLGSAGVLALGVATVGLVKHASPGPRTTAAQMVVVPWAGPMGGGLLVTGGF